MKFPKPHNGATAKKKDDKLTFTYVDSFGEVLTETRPILTPLEICQKVKDRMERFKLAGPGSRESDISRAERKWISAHDVECLRKTWDMLDDHGKMEFDMMFNAASHFGISDPSWAKAHKKKKHVVIGDNQAPL